MARDELARPVRRATFALVALSAFAVEVAAADLRPLGQSLGLAGVWVALAALAAWRVPVPSGPRPPGWLVAVMLSLGALPFAVEPLRREWTGDGYALELQMVCGLRNVGLGLAACAVWPACQRLAGVVSLFLTLFAAAMSNHSAVMALLGMYTTAGGVWLTLSHWAGLRAALVESEHAVEVLAGRPRTPWSGLALLALSLGGGVALAAVGPRRAALSLGELMPTSGGTGEADPFARYGVGDGPEETAGDNAQTTGMVETDKMIEDNKNSLIDAVSDMYGAPHKPPKKQERMVAAGLLDVIETTGPPPDNRRPSREFDTSRKGPKGAPKPPEGRAARALFEVEGRTPLHVRLVAYGRYDSGDSRWLEAKKPASRMLEPEGGDWMRLGQLREPCEWYIGVERHKLKVASLKSNLVPTPSMLTRFRINKVDKPDYYEWDHEGVLTLTGRKTTPPGVVVTTDCRPADAMWLPDAAFGRCGTVGGSTPELGDIPDSLRPLVERLAREWAGDLPRGGAQIDAVLAGLRAGYALDRAASAPPDCPDPVGWFLLDSKRGPDYLFAAAAVLMLRSLDYPARLCLGYYAAPDAFDAESGHTPVRRTDLHFWAEVKLGDGHWLVVEATPGYATLAPRVPFWERVRAALAALGRFALDYWGVLAPGSAALGLALLRRRELLDWLLVRRWRLMPGRTWRERVGRATHLLERRGRWAGRSRAPRETLTAWLRGAGGTELLALTGMAEWASYAPQSTPPWTDAEVLAECRAALDRWTLRRWRALNRPKVPGVPTCP